LTTPLPKSGFNKNNQVSLQMASEMNQIQKLSRLKGAICALAALLTGTLAAPAVVAYLPTVGVPPLRFESVTTNIFDYSRFILELANESRTNPAVQTCTNLTAAPRDGTNQPAMVAQPVASPPTATVNEAGPQGNNEDNVAGAESLPTTLKKFDFPASTASDLLTVTPLMIAQYLKPNPTATNVLDRPGAVVFVPADLPFMPPPPGSSSENRAHYHSP
jgi:hypothetical protein